MKSRLHTFTFLVVLLLSSYVVHAQIGISGSPHPSAALDVKSPGNDKAFYPPRLTTAQRNAIVNPQAGAFVYDIEKGTMYLHDGQSWLPLATSDPNVVPPISRTASDGGGYDYFGSSVAISGNYAIVGAMTNKSAQGAAYIFVRSGNGWSEQQKLTASDGGEYSFFGSSVSISGDYAVIGAFYKAVGNNANQGVAYIFSRSGNTWSEMQRLTASDGVSSDNFGKSVSISGDYVVIGAPAKGVPPYFGQGAAYIFVRSGNTWTQQQRITSSDGASNDNFGNSVAIDGTSTIIGAPNKSINGNSAQGAAYIFTRSGTTWTQQQRIISSDGAASDNFGSSVALWGDYAVVGAYYKTIGSNGGQGAAYVYNRSGTFWTQQYILSSGEGTVGDNFGNGVAISGDYIMIGAPNKTNGSIYVPGTTYLFKRINTYWQLQRRIVDNVVKNTRNGYSVGINNGTFIIGSSSGVGKVSFGTVD